MRTTHWVATVMALSWVMGCGGGGEDDGKRSHIACEADGLYCQSAQAREPVRLGCSYPTHEVGSCPTAGTQATCTLDPAGGLLHTIVYVYDTSSFTQPRCEGLDGAWAPVVPP